jgi:hypothetical protein
MTTPTLDQMQAVKVQSQAIGEFIEWLQSEKGWELAYRHKHTDDCFSHGTEAVPIPDYGRSYKIGEYRKKYADEKWLSCGCGAGQFMPAAYTIEKLLAEFFQIDLQKADNEKRALLEELHKQQPDFSSTKPNK